VHIARSFCFIQCVEKERYFKILYLIGSIYNAG